MEEKNIDDVLLSSQSSRSSEHGRSSAPHHECVMAMNYRGGSLGSVYYKAGSRELRIMQDITIRDPSDYIHQLLEQICPQLLIISSTGNVDYEAIVSGHDIIIEKMPNKDFAYNKGRYSLLTWYLETIDRQKQSDILESSTQSLPSTVSADGADSARSMQAYLRLNCHVDFNSSTTVGCVGAIFSYLQGLRSNTNEADFSASSSRTQPLQLRAFSIDKNLQAVGDTISSLDIIDINSTTTAQEKKFNKKSTLFDVLNKTSSLPGSHKMKQWVLQPVYEKEILEERYRSVAFFKHDEQRQLSKHLQIYLKQLRNISTLLDQLQNNRANANEWKQLLQCAYCMIQVYGVFNAFSGADLPAIAVQFQQHADIDLLKELGIAVHRMINFELSNNEGRIVLNKRVDDQLNALHERYDGLDDILAQEAEEISHMLADPLGSTVNVVYFPQLGYLLTWPVAIASVHIVPEQFPDFTLQFTSCENAYYKSDHMRELDERLGDIHSLIIDREVKLLHDLAEKWCVHSTLLMDLATLLAEIDCYNALAVVAKQNKYVKPEITNTSVLHILGGRHPMCELVTESFIPNDTYLVGGIGDRAERKIECDSFKNMMCPPDGDAQDLQEARSVMLLSGANGSGKSVYLTQVALIIYMAHIGSFVPADHASIGLTDKIFTRLRTSETSAKMQSAFTIDLQQVLQAIDYATDRSFLIMDEFGKGTNAADGAGLFYAVLNHFLSRKEKCPKIIASTHFHDIIASRTLTQNHFISLYTTEIMFVQMEQSLQGISRSEVEVIENEQQEVIFLYRVVPATDLSASFGICQANAANMPLHLIRRAMFLSECLTNQTPIPLSTESDDMFDQLERLAEAFTVTPADHISEHQSLMKSVLRVIKN
ncbi:muts domain V-domain-containing protein [Radiomyces spectabilis]|uniref:muts domain V-domain-containing protein n=1 Tax=Radiomyces spectabilis TaxID=64574 RepID=UPI00221FA3D8|nr:muts domain V-domain-containing protein [Radiomyces spectabilis]KAI8394260.1 muts domain V-domain-containing protein [Radiomyces spectabilis]